MKKLTFLLIASFFFLVFFAEPTTAQIRLNGDLNGNWFDTSSGNWEIGIYDSVAVYKSQVWNYESIQLKKGKGTIMLQNANSRIQLYLKTEKGSTIQLGEQPKTLLTCKKNPTYRKPVDDKPYEAPIFKMDSATYSGYIKGYKPKTGAKTLNLRLYDIVCGDNYQQLVNVSENGCFSLRIAIYHPMSIYVSSTVFNDYLFFEPGKELFQLIDAGEVGNVPLFMGSSAKINSDLFRLKSIRCLGSQDIILPEKTNNAFKTSVLKEQQYSFAELDSAYNTNTISTKAFQVKKLDILYNYLINLFDSPDSLTTDYCNFITNENTNNPLAALSSNYFFYLNRIYSLHLLNGSFSGNSVDLAMLLQKNGYVFTNREKEMVKEMSRIQSISHTPSCDEYWNTYYPKFNAFVLKNKVLFEKMHKETTKDNKQSIESYFLKNGLKLTNEEKIILDKRDDYESLNVSKLWENFDLKYHNEERFLTGFKNFVLNRELIREKKLKEFFNVQQVQCTDFLKCTSYYNKIVEDNTPLSDSEISSLLERISNPFFAEHLKWKNQQMREQIEANKKRAGYFINEVPKTDADKLFDAMMTKYKGKVVYVDFWATWCGPCCKGIKEIKPLKEEMLGKDVAFVYVTDVTSPEEIWSDKITDIKGEHYRLSTDEWNVLISKFNITGIPHYVLVGKKGEILNPNLLHLDNESLKIELEKRMKE